MGAVNYLSLQATNLQMLVPSQYEKQITKWAATAKIDPEHRNLVLGIAKQIRANKSRYMEIQLLTGVPWFFIAALHQKECSLNFSEVLHNGESLSEVNKYGTRIVPKGRGRGKNWTFKEAAVDALFYDKMHTKDLTTFAKCCMASERYNGMGFWNRGLPSIYVFSHTTVSNERGKYVSDGKWSSSAVSKNPGTASIWLGLIELGEDLFATGPVAPSVPSEIDKVTDNTSAVLKDLASKAGVLAPMERMLEFSKTIDFNKGPNYWGVIDFSKHSSKKRFYIFSVKDQSYSEYLVAHGKGSDRDHNGIADIFSNVNGSNCSSLGIYQANETYHGNHGLSLRLDGKEASNSRARDRAIVIHGADYVSQRYVNTNGKCGRSEGCPAVDMAVYRDVIDKLKSGSLIIAVA